MERLLPGLERRLKAEVAGGVQFDRFTRGRYATDASHYQIMPIGVVAPRTIKQARIALAIGREGASSSRRAAAAAFVLTCPSRSGQESNFGLRFLPIRQP